MDPTLRQIVNRVPYARMDLRYPFGQTIILLVGPCLVLLSIPLGLWRGGYFSDLPGEQDTFVAIYSGVILGIPGLPTRAVWRASERFHLSSRGHVKPRWWWIS